MLTKIRKRFMNGLTTGVARPQATQRPHDGVYPLRRIAQHRTVPRRTRANYRYHLEQNILPILGGSVLSEITPEDVRVWFAGLGTTYATRNARAYGVLTAVLNTAIDDGLIDRSPALV